MARRTKKPKQPKEPKYSLVPEDTKEGQEVRELIADMVKTHHRDLVGALIVPAWMIGNKPDRDGRLVLGKMKKASELERELHGFDAILLLAKEHWRVLKPEQKKALVDHELCHLQPSIDPNTTDQREDPKGRKLWRIRRHDIEEFRDVIRRHGCYLDDLRGFVEAAVQNRSSLFPVEPPPATPIPSKKPNGSTAEANAAAH